MAAGESLLAGITDFEFRRWVSALTLIRVSERPAEGLHALVSRTLRRAPNATLAQSQPFVLLVHLFGPFIRFFLGQLRTVSYVSNELRFKQLMSMIAQDPKAPWLNSLIVTHHVSNPLARLLG